MAVYGGAGSGHPNNAVIDDIMNLARGQQQEKQVNGRFTGKAKKLTDDPGQSDNDDEEVSSEVSEDLEPVTRYLVFWADGFTIGNQGRLRSFDNPRDAQLLQSIRSGMAPLAELDLVHGQPVEIKLIPKQNEKWSKEGYEALMGELSKDVPKKPFSGGGGRRLGDMQDSQPSPSPIIEPDKKDAGIPVNRSQPVTKIQVRLANGQKIIRELNCTQTIGDLKRALNHDGSSFKLLVGRPPAPIPDNDGMSLAEAGLLGCVIFQQPK